MAKRPSLATERGWVMKFAFGFWTLIAQPLGKKAFGFQRFPDFGNGFMKFTPSSDFRQQNLSEIQMLEHPDFE